MKLNKLRKTARLYFRFYKSYCAVSLIFTGIAIYLFYSKGIQTISTFFWLKVGVYALLVYVGNHFKQKEFYYYRNLGFSKLQLWSYTIVADFVLFVVLMIIISFLK